MSKTITNKKKVKSLGKDQLLFDTIIESDRSKVKIFTPACVYQFIDGLEHFQQQYYYNMAHNDPKPTSFLIQVQDEIIKDIGTQPTIIYDNFSIFVKSLKTRYAWNNLYVKHYNIHWDMFVESKYSTKDITVLDSDSQKTVNQMFQIAMRTLQDRTESNEISNKELIALITALGKTTVSTNNSVVSNIIIPKDDSDL